MEVYKFGGASVKDAAAIKNVAAILKQQGTENKVVVISAMGKTTNELEGVVNAFVAGNSVWKEKLEAIRMKHQAIMKELFPSQADIEMVVNAPISKANDFLTNTSSTHYQFIYDQVVSAGEFLSTAIVSAYCNATGLHNHLLDARKVIATDHAYTEARINWERTPDAVERVIPELLKTGFVITQGFIGSSEEGFTTTLGREGSDYTAAILSFSLNASRMTVWKDVEGIMNADPKAFPKAVFLSEISYHEAIEMTYYGANVIHPKTIKPLQNKNIPLEVRSFVHPEKKGSVISAESNNGPLPPVIIVKNEQMLLSFSVRDFSFIAEEHLSTIFAVFSENNMRVNLMQNAAISYSVVVDFKHEKIERIRTILSKDFGISSNDQLTLLTIRHYTPEIVAELTAGKDILLRQSSRNTIQILMK